MLAPPFEPQRGADGQEATMKRFAFSLAVVAAMLLVGPPAVGAHTKGLTLSRFGLVDVSLQANVVYATFEDAGKVDFDKIGDRHEKGFNLTSFDLSLSGETPEFPLKFALFLTFEQDNASIEEGFLFFHKLGEFHPWLSDFQATVGQFRAKFGQFNQIHDHEWFMADPPLIHTKFLGVDGVHLVGAELTYQVPLPFFLQLSLSAQIKGAEDGFPAATSNTPPTFGLRNAADLVWFPRVETYLELTDQTDLSLGVSAAYGRNKLSGHDHTTLVGG